MVRLPQNIIGSMHMGQPGATATHKELVHALINQGYGRTKAEGWISAFIETGQIFQTGSTNPFGLELYSCTWWGSPLTAPRRLKSPRIKAEELTEQERRVLYAKAVGVQE